MRMRNDWKILIGMNPVINNELGQRSLDLTGHLSTHGRIPYRTFVVSFSPSLSMYNKLWI